MLRERHFWSTIRFHKNSYCSVSSLGYTKASICVIWVITIAMLLLWIVGYISLAGYLGAIPGVSIFVLSRCTVVLSVVLFHPDNWKAGSYKAFTMVVKKSDKKWVLYNTDDTTNYYSSRNKYNVHEMSMLALCIYLNFVLSCFYSINEWIYYFHTQVKTVECLTNHLI